MGSLGATGTSIRPSSGPAAVPLHIHPALFLKSEPVPDPILIIIDRRYTEAIIVCNTTTMETQMMQSKPLPEVKWTR